MLGSGLDGDVDIRMQRKLFLEVQHLIPECTLLVEDLETFVVDRERQLLRDKMAVSWFETYVSIINEHRYISVTLYMPFLYI